MNRFVIALVAAGICDAAACASFSTPPSAEVVDAGDGAAIGESVFVPPPPLSCPSGAFFCDNFERETVPQQGWDFAKNDEPTARLSLAKKPFSGASALEVAVDPGDQPASAYLQKDILTGAMTTTALRFSIYYDTPPKADVVIAAIRTLESSVYVAVVAGGAIGVADQSYGEAGATTSVTKTFAAVFGRWRTVMLEYTPGPPATIKAAVDETMYSTKPEYASGPATSCQIGAIYAKASGGGSTFFVDEFVLTTR